VVVRSAKWLIFSSGTEVDIKKYSPDQKGKWKETTVKKNIAFNKLSAEEKIYYENNYRDIWKKHTDSSPFCLSLCKFKKWPNK